jgi:hypothetical protein
MQFENLARCERSCWTSFVSPSQQLCLGKKCPEQSYTSKWNASCPTGLLEHKKMTNTCTYIGTYKFTSGMKISDRGARCGLIGSFSKWDRRNAATFTLSHSSEIASKI